MPDKNFNVDDILRELNEKQQERPQHYGNQAYNQQPPPPPRRPAPAMEDTWEPVGSRRTPEQPVPAQQQMPVQPHRPEPTRRPATQQPTREIPRPPQPERLGQQPRTPQTREDMGRLLSNFSDRDDDPLDNLDFLAPKASDDNFFGEPAPPRRQAAPPPQRQAPAPRQVQQPQQPAPRQVQQPQQPAQPRQVQQPQQSAPPQRRPAPRPEAPPQRPEGSSRFGDPYGGSSIMQRNDRRSMAEAARLLTGGGMEDFPEEELPQRPARGRQPQPRRQQAAPPMQQPAQPRPRPSAPPRQGIQPGPPQDRFDKLDSLDSDTDYVTRPQAAPRPRPAPTPAPAPAPTPRPQREPRQKREREPQPEHDGEGTPQLAERLTAMRTSLMVRVVVNLLAMAAVIYLTLAGSYDFPLPEMLTGVENAATLLWVNVALVAVSALISGNTIGGGILAILKLRPSNDSYTSLTVFACLLQGAYMAMQPALLTTHGDNLYLPMATFMMLFNTLGKLIMMSRIAGSFGLTSTKEPKNIASIMDNREFAKRISADIIADEPTVVYAGQTLEVDGFLSQAFSESRAEDISRIVAPLAALASIVMALIAYLFNRDIFSSACVFTAALCITSPLASVIACNLPLSITNGKLARWGASICGYDAVDSFSEANGVVLRASRIFPKGSVTIQDIQVLDRRPIDQIIVDAASVLCSCDSFLAPVFFEMIQDRSMLCEAENHEFFDGMGLAAWVNGRRILIGNRNLMLSYGVIVPDAEYERQYTANGGEALYLANSGEASAIYFISYRHDKSMRRTLQLICDSDMGVCVYSHDPTLTAERISQVYAFPKELVTIIPATMHGGTEKYLRTTQHSPAMAIHNGSPASYLRTVLAARSCNRCVTLQTALLLMSVVLGFAIVTFLAFTDNMTALTWVTLTVFQFFWVLLELVVPMFKH